MTRPDAVNPRDDLLIDRIVDGELAPAELRAAVESLDREPDGWKRCALAFLEAQCLRESFQMLGEPAAFRLEGQPLSLRAADRPATARLRWLRGPIAAGIVAASFAMGWVGHAARPWPSAAPTPMAQSQAPHRNSQVNDFQSEPTNPMDASIGQTARFASWQPGEDRLPKVSEVVQSVGRLHIGNERTGTDVPILAGPGINEQWLRNQPPPVTEYGQVALQRQGYQVDQSRQFITTTLADGRRVTVPVDQVQIRYTGNNPL
jgi:hypothetical protein